jgi:hypothetical protein
MPKATLLVPIVHCAQLVVFVMMFRRQESVIHLLAFCPADFSPTCAFPLGTPSDAIISDRKICDHGAASGTRSYRVPQGRC